MEGQQMIFVPTRVFLTKGMGRHKEQLTSFEMSLRDARIANYNLVKVTSIVPPRCRIIPAEQGLQLLQKGQIVFVVLSQCADNEPHRLVAASIGMANPKDENMHGYLSEHHAFGQTEKFAGDYAEDLAATMLATTLGVEFDTNKSYDEQKELWTISGHQVMTRNITQSATVDKDGSWTTVVAAAVFVP